MHARYQQALAGARTQQFHRLVDALRAARQHDDGIRLGFGRRRERGDAIGKPEETGKGGGRQQDGENAEKPGHTPDRPSPRRLLPGRGATRNQEIGLARDAAHHGDS